MIIDNLVLDRSADALLKRAGDLFDLAKIQHRLAEEQHEMAAKQLDNADRQRSIATQQHCDADKIEANAEKMNALGGALVADAAEIKGKTQAIQRGE